MIEEFDKAGFASLYNYLYLPIDFNSKRNKGYAFVNLVSSTAGKKFARHFDEKHLNRSISKNILEVFPATVQGLRAAAEKHLRLEARVTNPYVQPAVFQGKWDLADAEFVAIIGSRFSLEISVFLKG